MSFKMLGELSLATVVIEGIMVRLESFDGTHGARATRRQRVVGRGRTWRVIGRGRTWRFGFGTGMGMPHCLDAHGGRAEVEVIEGWVQPIVLFDFINVLG